MAMLLPAVASSRVLLFTPQKQKPKVWIKPDVIPVTLRKSDCTYWCWASVGEAIALRYGRPEEQCKIATRVLASDIGPDPDCCQNRGACNQRRYLPPALGAFFDKDSRYPDFKTEQFVIAELGRKTPFGVRVNRNGGHFILINGYQPGNGGLKLSVLDPDDGFQHWWVHGTPYRSDGDWDITFETKQ